MMYRVHLSIGVSLTINSGFVQLIEENKGEYHTSEESRDNNIDSQDQEQYGRTSSCEAPHSTSSDDGNSWPPEMLYIEKYIQGAIHEEHLQSQGHIARFRGREEDMGGVDSTMEGAEGSDVATLLWSAPTQT
jgi:hypothetical protein